MIRLSTAAVVAGLLISAPAFAADLVVDAAAPPAADAPSRAYASVFLGASLPSGKVELRPDGAPGGISADIDFDTGYIVGGTIGTTLLPHLRGEVEFSVVKSTVSNFILPGVDLDSTGYNLLGNVWYDVDTGTSFTPYFGGGIGWGYDVIISSSGGSGEINTSGYLYQLGAGVRIAATDSIGFDLGYRYRVQPDANVFGDISTPGYSIKSSATNHIVTAGVTVGF